MTELTNIQDWQGSETARRGQGLASRLKAEVEAEQERWFLWLPVMFGLGIAGYFFTSEEPAVVSLWALVLFAVVLHSFGQRAGLWTLVSSALLAVSLGAVSAKLRTDRIAAPVLPRQMGPVDVSGWIERVEPRAGRGQRLTLLVISLGELSLEARPQRVRVRTTVEDPGLKAGQAVTLKASLGPPPWPAAPGDFDFGRLAWFSGLGGFGVVHGTVQRLEPTPTPPLSIRIVAPIESLRQAIRARIISALPGETGEIATALITGERGGISEATNQAYRDSGLFHILSISGLHMVIMAGAVFYLLRLGLAAVPSLALQYPIKKWAAAGAIIGAFGYLLISGAAVATVRSYVMITIMFAAVMLDRPALALRNVALAALLILIAAPENLLDAGFQMSFAAVVGLVSAYEYMRGRRLAESRSTHDEQRGPFAHGLRFLGEIMLTTVIASLVVAPFGIYHFHNTQLLAMIGNLFAIPICNIIVMPAALGVLVALPFGWEVLPLWVMGLGIDAMAGVARWVGALPGAVIKVPAIPTVTFALIVAGGLWLLLWQRPWRALGLVPIALGIGFGPTLARPDILIGRDGTTVAMRGADGRLSALAARGSAFELARWLELDGDRRTPAVVADGHVFRCDQIGCRAQVAGKSLAVAMSPAVLRDECVKADVLVLRFLAPRACQSAQRPGQVLIDPEQLSRAGAHAVYLRGGTVRVDTVFDARGRRPWSGPMLPRLSSAGRSPGRLAGFTSLFERFRTDRPAIEDEAWPHGHPGGEMP
jgi:competence protein ComEC